jgi:hypothetical protein
MMPLMSGGDAVVQSILGHGVSTIYCLPGVQSDHLFNAMFDAGDALAVVHTHFYRNIYGTRWSFMKQPICRLSL